MQKIEKGGDPARAWRFFFTRAGRFTLASPKLPVDEQVHLSKDPKDPFPNGAFAGFVSTDGVSLHVCTKREAAGRGTVAALCADPGGPAARAREALSALGGGDAFRQLWLSCGFPRPPFLNDLLTPAGTPWALLDRLPRRPPPPEPAAGATPGERAAYARRREEWEAAEALPSAHAGARGVRFAAVDPGETDFITAYCLSPMHAPSPGDPPRPSNAHGGPPRASILRASPQQNWQPPTGPTPHALRQWIRGHTFAYPTQTWNNRTGAPRAKRRRERRVRAAAAADRARVHAAISAGRTLDAARFSRHARGWLAAFEAGRALYGSLAARVDRFRVARAREREMHRIVQLLALGHTTVARGAARATGAPRRAPPPGFVRPALSIIGWGNANPGVNSPRSRAHGLGPTRALQRFIRTAYPWVHLIIVDEFRTSKVCTRCWRVDQKTHPTIDGVRNPHKLLACNGCAPSLSWTATCRRRWPSWRCCWRACWATRGGRRRAAVPCGRAATPSAPTPCGAPASAPTGANAPPARQRQRQRQRQRSDAPRARAALLAADLAPPPPLLCPASNTQVRA